MVANLQNVSSGYICNNIKQESREVKKKKKKIYIWTEAKLQRYFGA